MNYLAAQDWSAATRRSVRSSLRLFWEWCARRGLCEDVARELPTTPPPRSLPRPLEDHVILDALRAASPRVQLMIELMAYGGLRRCEVARVRSDDLQGQWLNVIGKGGHHRAVPLPPHLCARIRRVAGWLFPGNIDGHLSAPHVGKLVSRALPAGMTAHQLRHRFATTAYRTSRDIRSVQTLLGHAKLDTTMIYTQVVDDDRAAAAAGAWTLAS